eukprot:363222-Chlamydomonas_euryale.AAC.1
MQLADARSSERLLRQRQVIALDAAKSTARRRDDAVRELDELRRVAEAAEGALPYRHTHRFAVLQHAPHVLRPNVLGKASVTLALTVCGVERGSSGPSWGSSEPLFYLFRV